MAETKQDDASKVKGSDFQSIVTAYNLYNGWNQMSPAQKSLAISGLGMQGYRFSTGEDLAKQPLIKGTDGATELSLGQAFDLFSRGYNAYSLTKNWEQLNGMQKLTGGLKLATDVAKTAKSFNLLGYGSQGGAVQGLNASALASSPWNAASNYGIGAITAPAGTTIPTGYSALPVSAGEGVIAVPAGNMQSALGAIDPAMLGSGGTGGGAAGGATAASESGIPSVGAVAGAVTFAAGAYQVYQGWGQGGAAGRTNGAIGGSMMAAGLWGMGATNPYLLGGTVALSLLSGSIKTGKSGDQKARDGALSFLKERGAVGKDNTIRLPDGTVVDLGIDGGGNLHTAAKPDYLTEEHKKQGRGAEGKLNYWDVDYTNDLDYWSGTAGTSLTRLVAGGKNKAVDQLGGKIANGAIQNIGYGQEMNPDNFNKWRDNMRSVYSQFGVKSKADAYQLVNQMFAEERVNDSDAVSMQQVLNILYDDNGYDTAQTLSAGRHRGIQVATGDENRPASETVSVGGGVSTPPTYSAGSNEGEVFNLQPGANTFMRPPPGFKPVERQPTTALQIPQPQPAPTPAPNRQGWMPTPMTRSKDQIREQNRMQYGATA